MVSNLVNKIINTPIGRKVSLGLALSGFVFNTFAGGIINVWGATEQSNGLHGTQGSAVDYRDITLNKAIGSTVLDANGQYQIALDFSSGIEYDIVEVNNIKNIDLYNSNGQKIGDIAASKFNPNQLSSGVYFYNLNP